MHDRLDLFFIFWPFLVFHISIQDLLEYPFGVILHILVLELGYSFLLRELLVHVR